MGPLHAANMAQLNERHLKKKKKDFPHGADLVVQLTSKYD